MTGPIAEKGHGTAIVDIAGAVCNQLDVGVWTGADAGHLQFNAAGVALTTGSYLAGHLGSITQQAGALSIGGVYYLGRDNGLTFTHTMSGDSTLTVTGALYVGYSATATGILNQTGGNVYANGSLMMGQAGTDTGPHQYNLLGGTLTHGTAMSRFYSGTFTMRRTVRGTLATPARPPRCKSGPSRRGRTSTSTGRCAAGPTRSTRST